LYGGDKLIFINRAGLDFFGFKSLKEFNSIHSSVTNLFIEESGYINKHTHGKKWLSRLSHNNKNEKVKLFSERDKRFHSFYINVSEMKKDNKFLLSLNNITDLEEEKVLITKVAEYDALTKVYNRVKLNDVLNKLIYRANRYDLEFSIILLDIDHFKSINDTHGHNVGDKVLVTLARLITIILREGDVFARWGGEEFVVVLESTIPKDAAELAQRLRREIESFSFDIVGRVTCSFGVTEFRAGDKFSLLFERVDEALYEAKRNGRNQVVSK
jgi:diguanylate cyclase (GGDEF)-like protein